MYEHTLVFKDGSKIKFASNYRVWAVAYLDYCTSTQTIPISPSPDLCLVNKYEDVNVIDEAMRGWGF